MISLVTACMNREEHLRKALPAWLALPGIGEIVVVDWSNSRPLRDLTRLDPRIRVIRAEGEPRWILSYAYNLGVGWSQGDTILKCDSDCLPRREAADLTPGPGHFFAGYWRSGAPLGKASVNGQCLFSRRQFEAVNGYSELIRTYGRDDEDFYDRLKAAGFERREIDARHLDFLPHPHEARMANQVEADGLGGVEGWLKRNVVYNEMRNQGLAKVIPWGREFGRAPYREEASGQRWAVVRRDGAAELSIPAELAGAVHLRALRYVVEQALKLPPTAAARLTEGACLALLGGRLGRT